MPLPMPSARAPGAPPWSPETETRPEINAVLALRRPLTTPEAEVFRVVFDDIAEAYYDDVCATLAKWSVPNDDLPDLTQETFLRLWRVTVADGPPDVILAKLRGLAGGLAWNLGRREGRSPVSDRGELSSSSEPGSTPQLDGILDIKEVARKLFDALSREQQEVVDAVIFRDMTHEEAGLALGLNRTNVTKRLNVALDRLRELAPKLLSTSERSL